MSRLVQIFLITTTVTTMTVNCIGSGTESKNTFMIQGEPDESADILNGNNSNSKIGRIIYFNKRWIPLPGIPTNIPVVTEPTTLPMCSIGVLLNTSCRCVSNSTTCVTSEICPRPALGVGSCTTAMRCAAGEEVPAPGCLCGTSNQYCLTRTSCCNTANSGPCACLQMCQTAGTCTMLE